MNKSNNPDLIVSVESRKGGVGKTTAALCLARLLQKKGYAVLFLDLDVTGTNAADIARSPFWESAIHVINEPPNGVGLSRTPTNLITLFDQYFMTGKAIPDFSTISPSEGGMLIRRDRVNVLGSQIYRTDREERNSPRMASISIERPAILFDDLYTLWLLEFVKQLINNFARVVRGPELVKVAIILDNSPGYVGIAPAIQEWLTDCGPHFGKFLTVTSLDIQDMLACERAISALHGLYTRKWQASRQFEDACGEGSGISIGKDQEPFFLRMATSSANSGAGDPLAFYRRANQKSGSHKENVGQDFCTHPTKYIAALINRVPRAVKTGQLQCDFPAFLGQGDSTFSQLLGSGHNRQDFGEHMIAYDEYIENQFLMSLQRSRRRSEHGEHRISQSLHTAEEVLVREAGETGSDSTWFLKMDYAGYERLRKQLEQVCGIVDRARLSLDYAGQGHLARLIHDEWLPGSILSDFRSALTAISHEIGFPLFGMMPIEPDPSPESRHNFKFVSALKDRLIMNLGHSWPKQTEIYDPMTADILAATLASLVGLSSSFQLHHDELLHAWSGFLSGVLSIEIMHWIEKRPGRSRRSSLPRFLAQERVDEKVRLQDKAFSERIFVARMRVDPGDFARFYEVCARTQARLIDVVPDSLFILRLLRFMVEHKMESGGLFPFVRDLAESVIVNKSVSHEESSSKMATVMQTVEYFRDFDKVLDGILTEWGVSHE
jgi:hypothetical protein